MRIISGKWFWTLFFSFLFVGGGDQPLFPAKPVPPSTPIVITQIRTLDYGFCDNLPNTTFTIAAADLPGVSGCSGSQSGRFDVTAEPNERIRVTITGSLDVTNGTDVLNVRPSISPSGNVNLDATGAVTIYVGGNLKIPIGGVTTYGQYSGPATLTVVY